MMQPNWLRRRVASVRLRMKLRRREAYAQVFGFEGARTPAQEAVLADLRRFCRASTSCWAEEPRAHALLEGRREVFLRIQQFLGMTEEQILQLAEMEDGGDE